MRSDGALSVLGRARRQFALAYHRVALGKRVRSVQPKPAAPNNPAARVLAVHVWSLGQPFPTGIQRLTEAVAGAIDRDPPAGWSVRRLGNSGAIADLPGNLGAGDVVLCLDLSIDPLLNSRRQLAALRTRGVRIVFVVYDLIAFSRPDWFKFGFALRFGRWLRLVETHADAVIAISHHVARECRTRFEQDGFADLPVMVMPIPMVTPGHSRCSGSPDRITAIEQPCPDFAPFRFLMVGTVEPRKGYAQALDAFETLWRTDCDLHLTIVGKRGWLSDRVHRRLRHHVEQGGRLVWREECSDEELTKAYATHHALLATSFDEGFGLPIAEAAAHRLPVLARGIPVFREQQYERITFFDASCDKDELAAAMRAFAASPAQRMRAAPRGMPGGWDETAAMVWRACA